MMSSDNPSTARPPEPKSPREMHGRSRARQAATAGADSLPSARSVAALRRQNAELRALNAVADILGSSLDRRTLLEQALETLLHALRCRAVSILLPDWETQEIEVYGRQRKGREVVPIFRRFDLLTLAPGSGNQGPLAVSPLLECPASPNRREALVTVPLPGRERMLGLLAATFPDRNQAPVASRRLMVDLSTRIGLAVENAWLHERVQREADQLAAANAVGSAIRRSLRVPQLLDEALQQLLVVTNLEFGVVLLGGDTPAIAARSGIAHSLAARLSAALPRLPAGGEPLVQEDLPATWPGWEGTDATQMPRCLMHIPLRSGDRSLGLLTVGSYSQRHFAPGACDLLAGIASQISLALENARLYEELRFSARRLEAINAVATAANQTLEIDAFLHAALARVAEVADLWGTAVLLLDPEQSSLIQTAYQGAAACPIADLGRLPIPIGVGEAGRCALERRSLVQESADSRGIVVYLPLQSKGRLLGVIVAATRPQGRPAALSDLLQALAGQVAIGLDNALLYRETRERAAQLAETNEALREALRGKDQFLANVTHELKRPLAPARLVLEALLETAPGSLTPERQEELLRNALTNLDNLNALVSELLDAVRFERRSPPFATQIVDLRSLARRSLTTLRPLAEARGIAIHSILPSTAVQVRGDPEALARVIGNLLSNAIKFNKEAGSVLLQLERTADGRAVLAVTDTGIGIPSHARPHIFERFYQADGSSTRAHEGLGLGLYIAREIVERHGGQIRFDTEEGAGTTFTISLPLA